MKQLIIISLFILVTTVSCGQSSYNKDIYPLIKKEMYAEALPLLQEFLESTPKHVNANYWCAKILESEGRKLSNASLLEKSIACYKTCSFNVNAGDMTMITAGRYPDAIGVEAEIRLSNFKAFLDGKVKELSSLKSKISATSSGTSSSTDKVSTIGKKGVRKDFGGGFEITDSLGNTYEARYFDNQSNEIQIETYVIGDKITIKKYARDEESNVFLLQLESKLKVISPFNNQPCVILDGRQAKLIQTISSTSRSVDGMTYTSIWQKEETFYEKNVVKSKTLYYPSSDKVYCKIICKPVSSKVGSDYKSTYPGQKEFSIPTNVTYYHKNGKEMLSYNPAIFNTWKWDNSLVTSRSCGGIRLIKLEDFFPELNELGIKTLDVNCYLPDDDNGNYRQQEITSDNTTLELFNNSGVLLKKITLVKTESSEGFKYQLQK